MIIFWILAISIIIFIVWYILKRKVITGDLCLISGGVKTGKTLLSIHLAIKEYKSRLNKFKFKKFVIEKIFFKSFDDEMPLFYSNMPIKCKFPIVFLTSDLILRQKRFNYKSIIFIDEASLVADSQNFRDDNANARLTLFNKLISHSTRGGKLFYNTQNFSDCHYAIKRSLSTYIHILKSKNIPFFRMLYVKEMFVCDENNLNVNLDDTENNCKIVLVPKSVYKCYDRYYLSSLTDEKPIYNNVEFVKSLKFNRLLSFNEKDLITRAKENEKERN